MTAALQLIRWETLDQVGLYDEGYRLCFEDVDYCLRVFEAGLRVHLRAVGRRHRTTRATSAASADPEDRALDARVDGPHARAVGRRGPVPLGSGDAVMSLPKTLFLSRGDKAAAWYRCALPALALGSDWIVLRGEPPDAAASCAAAPSAR